MTKKLTRPHKKTGRPSRYTEEIAVKICSRLAKGMSLRKVCLELKLDMSTVFLWMSKHPEFSIQYARAKEECADFLAEEILEIADKNVKTDAFGRKDSAEVNQLRLRVDARKWIASKLKPKRYGERITQEHSGPDGTPIQVITSVPQPEPPAETSPDHG